MAFYRDRLFLFLLMLGPLFWVIYGTFFHQVEFASFDSANVWLAFLQIGFVFPVLEEIVFRGGLQGMVLQKYLASRQWKGISNANVLTSIVFATFHLYSQSLSWAFLIFFPSLVFGYVFDRYQSLWPPIILHSFYNVGFFLFFYA